MDRIRISLHDIAHGNDLLAIEGNKPWFRMVALKRCQVCFKSSMWVGEIGGEVI